MPNLQDQTRISKDQEEDNRKINVTKV